MAKKNYTYKEILKSIEERKFAPVYLLMGEEAYYIDVLCEKLAGSILPEEERGFNQVIMYCTHDTSVKDIINNARRFPMMSEYQVVIVKEAQNLSRQLDELVSYVSKPMQSTVLVLCHKNGSVDKRRKLVGEVEKNGVVFESLKLKDGYLPSFIREYLASRGVKMDSSAMNVLAEHVGNDLCRLAGELDKLIITLQDGTDVITSELVEQVTGISKEYNMLELRSAIISKDVFRSNRIMEHFIASPKANPPQPVLALLFNFFANVMQLWYAPDKSEAGMMNHMDLSSQWQLRDLVAAMHNYPAMKVMQILGRIREADGQLKGIGKGSCSDGDILRELLFFILH